MTNAELYLETAVKKLNNNLLTGQAKEFISQIKDYDKKKLRTLSKAQYKFLTDISN